MALDQLRKLAVSRWAARRLFKRSQGMREELAKSDPKSAQASFDVVLSRYQHLRLEAQEENAEAMRRHLVAMNKRLEVMSTNGQIEGFTQREQLRDIVQSVLADLPKP